MAKILVVVASGPKDGGRAKEGLSLARAICESLMAESVQVLLLGEGVRCVARENDDLRLALEAAIDAGVRAAACTGSLAELGLIDRIQEMRKVEPVGAPVFVSSKADEGFVMLTF